MALPLLPRDAAELLQHLLDCHLGVFEGSSQTDPGSDMFATVLASRLVETAAKDGALPLLLAQQLRNAAVKCALMNEAAITTATATQTCSFACT